MFGLATWCCRVWEAPTGSHASDRYRVSTLNRLVFVENAMLLLLGLGAGVLAALAAVVPSNQQRCGPWPRLSLMLGVVLIVGLGAAWAAVMASVRTPIVEGCGKSERGEPAHAVA